MSLSIDLDPYPRCMAEISPAVLTLLGTPTGVETQRRKESPLRRMVVCVRGIKLTGGLPSGTLEDPADEVENSA